jgi:hypothetical protein
VQNSDVFMALLVVAAIAFQTWVTVRVRRSENYDAEQKRAQTRLIWLLPVIGAALAFAVLEDEDRKDPPNREQQG